jgi:hypothetical protein
MEQSIENTERLSMHTIMLPIVFLGLLTRSINKRLSSMMIHNQNQDNIDYIFATMVNGLNLTDEQEKNDSKTNN